MVRLEEAMLRTLFWYLMSSEWLRRHVYGTCLYDFSVVVEQRSSIMHVNGKRAELCMWWVGGSLPVSTRIVGS